jgi:predicted O-methyltransferase YrrM
MRDSGQRLRQDTEGTKMNPLIKEIYTTGQVKDREGNSIDCFPASIPYESGSLLYELISQKRPERTLEVGMAYGLSTLFICQALKNNGRGRHTAIDPFQDSRWKSIGLLNVERAGLGDIFSFHQLPSYEALPKLHFSREKLDFAFIDGMHLFDFILLDFFYIDRLINIGGHIVFDDIWMPSTRKALSFILRNRSYRLVKPSLKNRAPLRMRAAMVTRRFLQNPFEKGLAIKFLPSKVCVLEKLDEDKRYWTHYRSF